MKSLEEILKEYFGCKRPYNKDETLSLYGESAYAKLVSLLQDIDNLLGTDYLSKYIDELDELAPSNDKRIGHFLDKYGNIID